MPGNHFIHATHSTRRHLITVHIKLRQGITCTSKLLRGVPTLRLDGMSCTNSVHPKEVTIFHTPLITNTLLMSLKDRN